MTKNLVQYHVDIDYEATIQQFQAFCLSHEGCSFEVTGGRGRAGAQIVASFKHLNVTMNIYHTGLVQISYGTFVGLREAVKILKQYCVPRAGEFPLVALDPDDPIDRSVEMKTIYHFHNTDAKYAIATVLVYWWRNPETGEYIAKIPDRDFKLDVPGFPFVFDSCVPVSVHVMDKFDEKGNKIVDAEKLRRKGIEELKRIAREHSRVKFKDGRCFDVPEE
jgi:hypothetical protein